MREKRLVNDNPTTNTETMLNLAYAKDGNVYLRYGTDDMNLCDYVSALATNKGCNYTSTEIMEGACLECDCEVNLLYCLAVQAAELRERLKYYEDLEEQGRMIISPCKVGADVYIYIAEIDAVCPAKVTEIYKDYQTTSTPVWIELFYKTENGKSHGIKLSCDVFKLLCHSTKEEAERKHKSQ